MHTQTQCECCEGSGKCVECDGTGINPHLNSTTPKCPNCRGSAICPNCKGTAKSAIARPLYRGNLLKYGALWAGILVSFWSLVEFAHSRIVTAIALVVWIIFWYVVFYRTNERGQRDSDSANR
jgi:hypothetical protein